MQTTSVLLVEDHRVLRDGLRSLIERDEGFEVIAETGDGVEAVEITSALDPDVVVMDVWIPRLSGIEATRRIVESGARSRVLVLSQHDSWSIVQQAFDAGASGYVLKKSSAAQLLSAVRAVREGRRYVPAEIEKSRASGGSSLASPLAVLTGREREVLQLIGEGSSTREIARTLGIAARTAEAHRANVMSKLDVHKVTDLVRLAIREGLFQA